MLQGLDLAIYRGDKRLRLDEAAAVVAPPLGTLPLMWTWVRTVVVAFLFDEAAFQRYLAAGCYLAGSLIESGGVVPGTTAVIPGVAAHAS